MDARTYTCKLCGGTFESEPGWTVEDSDAEAERYWGVKNAHERTDMASVCDVCWETIRPDKAENAGHYAAWQAEQ